MHLLVVWWVNSRWIIIMLLCVVFSYKIAWYWRLCLSFSLLHFSKLPNPSCWDTAIFFLSFVLNYLQFTFCNVTLSGCANNLVGQKTPKALLKQREYDPQVWPWPLFRILTHIVTAWPLQVEKNLLKRMVVTETTPLQQQGGWWCDVCECALKDSTSWLDHINGRRRKEGKRSSLFLFYFLEE